MNNEKPQDIDEYKAWLDKEHGVEISDRTRVRYESVTSRMKLDFERSVFWVQVTQNLKEFDGQYLAGTGYRLLMPGDAPELKIKPFESFLLKTFRKNVVENKDWPNEPVDGWILPDNWYSTINDIIRTTIVVKYLDGVQFMIDKIGLLCEPQNMPCKVYLEAREEGYYAGHLYTANEFEIPKVTWDTERARVSIEIQITTQLQEVIRKLLHKYYEERRASIREEDIKWQWNYKSDEFVANYLGHILHYVEGMIMEIRERQKEETV